MSEALDAIIASLRESIAREVAQERARADEAQRCHQTLLAGLRNLLDGIPDVANDTGACTSVERKSRAKVQPRGLLPDEVFLSCLTREWITAGQIFKRLRAQGFKVAEGTVYNRMRTLWLARPKDIETAVNPERWRLRVEEVQGSADHSGVRRAAARPRSVAKSSADAAACSISAPIFTPRPHSVDHPVLRHGDCLHVMRTLPDDSVDLILADLPYGTTGLDIDRPLPLEELWAEYRRILKKPHGNIVLFGSQPFTSKLVASAEDIFRHDLVWEKNKATGFQHASAKPLKRHEDILVFSYGVNISEKRTKRRASYNPLGASKVTKKAQGVSDVNFLAKATRGHEKGTEFEGLINCPHSILRFPKDKRVKGEAVHPFAKPVALLEYLIRTYSNEGEVVLDNTMGSGTTGMAALNAGRRFIGIEKDQKWFEVARERIEAQRVADQRPIAPIPSIPKVQTGEATIYQGDCLEVMRSMPSGSVDLIVTSPPYNLGLSKKGGNGSKRSLWPNAKLYEGYGDYDDNRPHDEYVAWQQDVLKECWRLISDKGAIFYNHKPRIQRGKLWLPHELNPNLPLRQEIIWDRGSGINHGETFCTSTHERILLFAKPKFKFLTGKPRDVWRINFARNNDHPAPFPLELPMAAIRHTDAESVLDPFMGSGTTGVAAKRLGRRFIGIERNGEYVEQAWKRIEAQSTPTRAA